MYRTLSMVAVSLIVAACAMPQRKEPPAPIVESTKPAEPVVAAPEPAPAPKPAPKPAGPQPTKVYAYTPPESIPDQPPEPAPVPAQAPPAAKAAQTASAAAPATAAKPEPPKPAPKAKPTPSAPSTAETPPKPAPQQQPAAAPPPAAAQAPKPAAQAPKPAAQAPAPAPAPAAPPAPEVAAAPPRPALAPAGMPPAVDALAGRAEQQRQTGDYAGAAATLERALRIQPQEAYLWNRLARVRLEQGLGSQAGNLAARSNALAGSQAKLKQNNWDIIATTRRQSGDIQGALEAERMAGGG
jgi:hypothetical protein